MTTTVAKAAGYTDRFILIGFPELAEGCSVLIRNPRLMPPEKLEAVGAAADSPDPGAGRAAMNAVMADIIVAWRNIYPADESLADVDVEALGDDLEGLMAVLAGRSQEPLAKPTIDTVARLPLAVTNRIAEEFKKIADPR
jgi:hypothetical protein